MPPPAPSFACRIAELVDALTRVTRELQFVDGLNPAQWEVLRFLGRANRYSRSPGAVADFLGTTKGTVSQTLIALETKGLLQRVRSEQDRRAVLLKLTAQGEALLARDPIAVLEQASASLGEAAGTPVVKALSRLLHDLQSRSGLKTFGVCRDCTLFCVAVDGAATPHCGLTHEALEAPEQSRICVNFQHRPGNGMA